MGNREEVIVSDAKKMIRQPLQLIEIVLLKHQEAVLEVCKEQQEKIERLEVEKLHYHAALTRLASMYPDQVREALK